MSKTSRAHKNVIAESETAADELEKLIKDEVEGGTLKVGSRDYLDYKRTLKGLRDAIGLAKRRGR